MSSKNIPKSVGDILCPGLFTSTVIFASAVDAILLEEMKCKPKQMKQANQLMYSLAHHFTSIE